MDLRYAVTRMLYRPLSLPVASVIARTSITPAQITWVSAVLAVGGAVGFAFRAYLLGAALTLVGVITDCVDGDLARITRRTSRSGAFLDSILDRWTDSAMILGLGFSDLDRFGMVAGVALVASLLTSYTRARAQSLGADCPEGIGGRDTRILVLVVTAPLGFVFAGLAIVAVLGSITSVHRAVNASRVLHRLDLAERGAEAEI